MTATSTTEFGPLVIEYDARVLTPRPWTALQSEWAAELLLADPVTAPDLAILELCSGAGHIGLLAARLSGRALVTVDVDPVACAFERANAARAGLAERVDVREGAMESALGEDETFALVIADPPWVTTAHTWDYPEDPRLAIDGGTDGLDLARACVRAADGHVVPGGSVLLQLGDDDQCDRLLAELPATLADGGRRPGAGGVVLRLVQT